MTYNETVPTVYAVFFEDLRILKVGVSREQRWRNFLARGARLVETLEFVDYAEARIFERRNHHHLARTCTRGFASRAEAEPFLGLGGDGWTETYHVPEGVEPIALLRALPIATG